MARASDGLAGRLTGDPPSLTSRLQLAIPLREDLPLSPGHPGRRGDVADGAVQTHLVVIPHVALHEASRVLQRQRHAGADALGLQRAMPPLDLAVALRVVRRR